jgi:methionyl-tRNA formyltransferase
MQLAKAGHVPAGVISLPSLHWTTGMRKIMQWGLRGVVRYVANKSLGPATPSAVRNSFLRKALEHDGRMAKTVNDAAQLYGFPIFIAGDLNSVRAVEKAKEWRAELIVYTGGGLIRKPMMEAAPLGVLNSHIALLPEIRGMSAPEWSLLEGVRPGVTIHFMDSGIDTGPIVLRRELSEIPESIGDLRNQLVALGIDMLVETVLGLAAGTIAMQPQANSDRFPQYFVMHEKLVEIAEARLAEMRQPCRQGTGGAA